MQAPKFWFNKEQAEKLWYWPLLKGLSRLYTWLHQQYQQANSAHVANIPVFCVGNIVAGGAGKTPTAIALYEILKNNYDNIAFLSRGYGGDLEGPVFVDLNIHRPKDVGDEPLLLARHARTIIAKNKADGARYAEQNGIDCLILDDGFQNPHLKKDCYILVIDGRGFGNEYLLPAGPLREPIKDALEKTDIVIATGPIGDNVAEHLKANWLPVYKTQLKPSSFPVKGEKVFGFAGIAHPEKFKTTLEENGYDVVGFTGFPDHHPYSEQDMQRLYDKARGTTLITTEKDAVKIPTHWKNKVEILPVTLEIEKKKELQTWLEKHLSQKS